MAQLYTAICLLGAVPTHDFLMRAWNLFSAINRDENKQGLPGARAVLATGFRMRGRRAGQDATATHFQSVMRRFQKGAIAARQAIREVANIRQSFDIIPQLQANFAFSKAYVANSSGTKGGLAGANFFVDLALFDTPTPEWIVTRDPVKWSNQQLRMEASFAAILAFPPYKHVQGGPLGIRDGLQVAQHLTQDPHVLRALRTAQKTS
jgi:hypothetical protein